MPNAAQPMPVAPHTQHVDAADGGTGRGVVVMPPPQKGKGIVIAPPHQQLSRTPKDSLVTKTVVMAKAAKPLYTTTLGPKPPSAPNPLEPKPPNWVPAPPPPPVRPDRKSDGLPPKLTQSLPPLPPPARTAEGPSIKLIPRQPPHSPPTVGKPSPRLAPWQPKPARAKSGPQQPKPAERYAMQATPRTPPDDSDARPQPSKVNASAKLLVVGKRRPIQGAIGAPRRPIQGASGSPASSSNGSRKSPTPPQPSRFRT